MDVSLVSANALLPMAVTLAGMVMAVRPDLTNTPSPSSVTVSGIVKEVRLLQPSKIQLGILVMPAGSVTLFSAEHS